jgi:group 4 capsule polysaccharide lipoprotein GfcB/YjbF
MTSRIDLAPPKLTQRMRVTAAIASMAMILAGCGVVGRTSIKTVQMAMQGKPDVQPTAQSVAANRYPQIKVSGSQGGAILILGNIEEERQAWYSSDRSIVFLKDGLIVGTHGGTPQLQRMHIEGVSPFHHLHLMTAPVIVERRYDVMPGYRFGMEVTGTLERLGTEDVKILGNTRTLLHVRERLRGQGWRRDNHYWVDSDNGFIWKSVQAIAPDASLEIVQLKPYAPDLKR